MNRRELLKLISAGALGSLAQSGFYSAVSAAALPQWKGNIRHSVCRWTFGRMPLPELCAWLQHQQIPAIDLVGPQDWPVLKEYGIHCSMCNGAEISLEQGWNNPVYHETLISRYLEAIDLVAEAGYTNLICFSGNRNGMDDETGLENCVSGLRQILPHAQERGVVIQMELFNSKIDHPDYMCDNTPWGLALCERLGSPNFKLLYDIYHMQISEGDIIRTIRDHHAWFGHYHTAGVPGRNEIGDTQELFYPAIMRAITETGFEGYVAQEFIPTAATDAERLEALKQAFRICDV
ncbi:hydroxypyruvate isomerase [Cyclonatronum proteinivorum]|uniref:Hydroxypyruvate isomerase n=1 Tax=Cyclonatronum proteinivorum TaxID=1457365 RepID=A0A345UL23_9BACT|nr:TIM barrel protein [Cyclonatronum proteinivorum]AXJ01175.1 hydroxypyruvate isomerase [Cyclonatronum proteinivorum]